MPFKIVRNDITQMQVDAIVNTANCKPIYSTGTDAAVYEAAGVEELLAERRKIGFLNEGEVAITPGFQLPAKYIIHAASPRYVDGLHEEEERLRSCYEKSLQIALEYDCKSIAFPLISTGSFGYPRGEAMEIALSAIRNFLLKEDMMVYLVVFDRETVRLSGQIFDEIEAYIDENYVAEKQKLEYGFAHEAKHRVPIERSSPLPTTQAPQVSAQTPIMQRAQNLVTRRAQKQASQRVQNQAFQQSLRSLEDIVSNVGETFQQRLLRLIDERGRNDVEVYKGAGKDKKLFYKIKSNINYQPTKHTVFAFALSLQLSLDEMKDLLESAGFALSPSSRFDLIMQYVFEREIYDMYKIDCILYDFGEEHYFSCE